MTYGYSFTIIDGNGNIIVERELTAEQAINILVETTPTHAEEIEPEQAPEPIPATKKQRGRQPGQKNKCANCGTLGHTSRTCQQTISQRKCSACGKPGHIARHCADQKSHEEESGPRIVSERITEDQFDELQHLKTIGDLNSKEFATENDVPLSEVNRAIFAKSYEDYLDF